MQDATRTEPVIAKKRLEAETPSIPTPAVPTGPPKPPTATPPKAPIAAPKIETRPPQIETGAVPPTGPGTQASQPDIPLSKEAPMAEHFFDELKSRISKTSDFQEGRVSQTTPGYVAPAAPKPTAQVPAKQEATGGSEEDIKRVLQRLKDSIKKA